MNKTKTIRKCPYCHCKVSIWRSLHYFFRGTNYSIQCNHCHQRIKPQKEPIPFQYCVCAGFFSVVLPIYSYIYMYKGSFADAVLFAIPFFILVELIISLLILIRIQYIKL